MYREPLTALCDLTHESAHADRREQSDRFRGVLAEMSLRNERTLFEHARLLKSHDAFRDFGPADIGDLPRA